jgi:hypothetical protein
MHRAAMTTSGSPRPAPPPALAIVNARVWTNDPQRPWADAVLVREDRVLAVGSSAELRKRAGPTATIVDARGWLVLPSHATAALAPGSEATLHIVERATSSEPPAALDDDAVVFSLIAGRIERDRRGLAG